MFESLLTTVKKSWPPNIGFTCFDDRTLFKVQLPDKYFLQFSFKKSTKTKTRQRQDKDPKSGFGRVADEILKGTNTLCSILVFSHYMMLGCQSILSLSMLRL